MFYVDVGIMIISLMWQQTKKMTILWISRSITHIYMNTCRNYSSLYFYRLSPLLSISVVASKNYYIPHTGAFYSIDLSLLRLILSLIEGQWMHTWWSTCAFSSAKLSSTLHWNTYGRLTPIEMSPGTTRGQKQRGRDILWVWQSLNLIFNYL